MSQLESVVLINCVDGTVQDPVQKWIERHFEGLYTEVITVFAPDEVLSGGPSDLRSHVTQQLELSAASHQISAVIVVGHAVCATNPRSKPEQVAQIRSSIGYLMSIEQFPHVVGLWVDEDGNVELTNATGMDS